MLNILSGFIGLVTLILMIPAVLPLLGALNWILVPMALFGAFIGLMLEAILPGRARVPDVH